MKKTERTKTSTEDKQPQKTRLLLIPDRVLFIITIFFLVLGCVAFFYEKFVMVWILTGVALLPFIIIDMLLLIFFCDRLQAEREISSSFARGFAAMAQGESVKIKLIIKKTGKVILPFPIWLFDLHPNSMSTCIGFQNGLQTNMAAQTGVFPLKITNLQRQDLKKAKAIVLEYILTPNERGPWAFSGLELLLPSPLRIWKLRVTHSVMSEGRTYPNFKQIARGADLKGKFEKGEIRKIRKRGQGLEFESLRDYQEGDSIRLIDWRATSRNSHLDGRVKLIVKNYQEEQDQQVLFIIDSGYRLPDCQFDSALGAMLLLSFVALKHGDAVAAASFGAHELWIPPRKGVSTYTGLMNGLYDLHSAPIASSPFLALENALSRLNRRTFIVLVSNFREEDDRSLSLILPQIKKRHLLLMVSFRESEVEEVAFPVSKPITDEEILQTAAAKKYLANRKRLYRKWEHSGLFVLETSPKYISGALISKYLSIKKSGRL